MAIFRVPEKLKGKTCMKLALLYGYQIEGLCSLFFFPFCCPLEEKILKSCSSSNGSALYYGKFKTVLAGSRFSAPAKV
jgi:hypothetical protein